MFYYISGALTHLAPGVAVVDAGGVGYKLSVSNNTLDAISPAASENKKVKLYTYLAVREDGMELFGFHTEQELAAFKLLISVSGGGPKVALSVLSCFTPDAFAFAVCNDDRKSISKANGVGAKTAARIVLELHDKMSASELATPIGNGAATPAVGTPLPRGSNIGEAEEALTVLGYSRVEIANALRNINTAGMQTEEIIRAALKNLM